MALEGRISSLESDNGRLRNELLSLKRRFNLGPEESISGLDDRSPEPINRDQQPQHHHQLQQQQQKQQKQQQQQLLGQHLQKRFKMSSPPSPPVAISSQSMIRHAPSPPLAAKAPLAHAGRGGAFPHINSYASPPPLLAVAGAMQMGMAVYSAPGGPAAHLPYFFPEASAKMSHEAVGSGGGAAVAASIPIPGRHATSTGNQSIISTPSHQHHHGHHRQHPHLPNFPVDIKQEHTGSSTYEEEFARIRERSNSNVERRSSSFPIDMADLPVSRRGSLGNQTQYHPAGAISPPISSHLQSPHLSRASNAKHHQQHPHALPPFMHRPSFEGGGYPHSSASWSDRSPESSHSSDDNYDEPLQLTVRRESTLSSLSNISTSSTGCTNNNASHNYDDNNSHESDQGGRTTSPSGISEKFNPSSTSPPASSFPLKLRHKLPPSQHDIYPAAKDLFPALGSAALTPNPHQTAAFSSYPFINGLAQLSDMALSQNNPLSLIKKESSTNPSRPSPARRDSVGASTYHHHHHQRNTNSSSRRNHLDQKYFDPKYLERRRRNNEAARKCRENRKNLTKIREAKSDYLENENNKLRDELNGLQEEMKQLRELIEKRRMEQGLSSDDFAPPPPNDS